MKKIIFIISIIIISFFFASCSDDDDDNVILPKISGSINITYKDTKLELKEMRSSYYISSETGDTLGYVYYGFLDHYQQFSKGGVALYISKNFELERIEFYKPDTDISSTQYVNYKDRFDDELTLLDHTLTRKNEVIEGEFSGKLFNAAEIIEVSNCKFYIEDRNEGRYR